MCGIAGRYNITENSQHTDEQKVRTATERIAHRGPDFSAVVSKERACFGHARLSIIDTSPAGNQPMADDSGRYLITYNGELFNFVEVREKLIKKGVVFNSKSDTEVVLNAYIHFGAKCLHEFNGFFAFVIYDRQTHNLFAARDRMGIKPFYYNFADGQFNFSSELSGAMALVENPSINHKALHLFFRLTYVPAPHSMIDGVLKLEPGHYIEIKSGHFQQKRYYNIRDVAHSSLTLEESVVRVRQELERSVKMRLVSDVPVGTFLSGGIDSSIVTSIAAQFSSSLEAFSLGFSDEAYLDESSAASTVAKSLGVKHNVFMVSNDSLSEHLPEMLDNMDEPFADSSALAVFVLSKRAANNVKVVLSGDGADEVFGGYRKHMAMLRSQQSSLFNVLVKSVHPLFGRLPKSRSHKLGDLFRKAEKYSSGLQLPLSERYWNWLTWTPEHKVNGLLLAPTPDKQFEEYVKSNISEGDLNTLLLNDQDILLPGDMLTKTDRMSMANGLEVRTPFLDHQLVNLVNGLPIDFKANSARGKRLLRSAFKDDLPEVVFNSPKRGFEIPIETWLRQNLQSELIYLSDEQLLREQSVFNYEEVSQTIRSFIAGGKNQWAPAIWSFYVFQKWWLRHFRPINNIQQ